MHSKQLGQACRELHVTRAEMNRNKTSFLTVAKAEKSSSAVRIPSVEQQQGQQLANVVPLTKNALRKAGQTQRVSYGGTTQSGRPPSSKGANTKHSVSQLPLEHNIHLWQTGFISQPNEYAFWVSPEMVVQGSIPAQLSGTWIQNCPGFQGVGDKRATHFFDGDGMLLSLAFEDGKAFFRNKYVRTKEFVQERRAGQALYRRTFSKGHPLGGPFNFDLQVANLANTNVMVWGDRAFALYEAGLPHEVRASDLSTVGLSQLDGTLQVDRLHAHYRKLTQPDGSTRLVTFGTRAQAFDLDFEFYEYSSTGKLVHSRSFYWPNSMGGFFHDIAVTDNYYVLYHNPMEVDFGVFGGVFAGAHALGECFQHNKQQPARVLLVPRWGHRKRVAVWEVQTFECPSRIALHHINAFECEKNGQKFVVLDTITYGSAKLTGAGSADLGALAHFQDPMNASHPQRFVLNLTTQRAHSQTLNHRLCEMPQINATVTGRPHRHAYSSCVSQTNTCRLPQAISKLTVHPDAGILGYVASAQVSETVRDLDDGEFVTELCIVPKPSGKDEDDCWLITFVHNAHNMSTRVLILDTKNLDGDAVATIQLPVYIPQGLHGTWADSVFMDTAGATVQPGSMLASSILDQRF